MLMSCRFLKQSIVKLRHAALPAVFLALVSASGCAKNVDRFQFTKWGNSFIPAPQGGVTQMDTSAQGGAAQNGVIPKSPTMAMPRAAVGGSYQRNFATSSHYRMVGGFHVNNSGQ